MTKKSLGITPKNVLGKWSVGLIVAMVLLFFLGSSFTRWLYDSVPAGNTIMEDIASRPALALSMLAGTTTGVASFVTGLLAIVRQKERSLLVYISTVIGALLVIFLIGEFVFPH